jgi:hypothetical protein
MKPQRPSLMPLASACAAVLLLGGCYENVVGVRGPAVQNYDLHEPNIQPGESVWSEEKPRPVDPQRYGTSGTTLDRARPIPSKNPPKPNNGN